MTYALGITSLNNFLLAFLPFSHLEDGLPYSYRTLVLLSIVTIIFLPLLWLLLRNCYLPIMHYLPKKEHGIMAIFSILLFLLLVANLIPLDYSSIKNHPFSVFAFFVLIISIFLLYFLCFRLFHSNHQNSQINHQLNIAKNQIWIQNEQYIQIQKNIETSRKLRHDMQHHIHVIHGFLIENNLEAALDYLEKYDEQQKKYAISKFCDNSVINLLISFYYNLTMDSGIDFSCHIQANEALPLEAQDLSVILGNLLENALDAATVSGHTSPRIYITITQTSNLLIITVDNSYNGIIQKKNGQFVTVKENHAGLGLCSIIQIAEKYHGGTEFTYDDKEFHSSVMLCFPE